MRAKTFVTVGLFFLAGFFIGRGVGGWEAGRGPGLVALELEDLEVETETEPGTYDAFMEVAVRRAPVLEVRLDDSIELQLLESLTACRERVGRLFSICIEGGREEADGDLSTP